MAKTYCLKSCADCQWKEQLSCPGCHQGPGERFKGDCALKTCCAGRGHETCETCNQNSYCGTFRGREQMPEQRLKNIEAERQRRQILAQRSPILGKWLTLMFWLMIPSMIASLMLNKTLVNIPALQIPGLVLQGCCVLAQCAIMLRLSKLEKQYQTAAVCILMAQVVDTLTSQLVDPSMVGLYILVAIVVTVLSTVGVYNQYMAHSNVLLGVDDNQAHSWETLWKWHIGLLLGTLGCTLLLAIAPLLGALALLAAAIGIIVVSITEMVYLYRTARIFREYSQELE